MSSLPPRPTASAGRPPVAEDLSAPATQIVRDREAYLGQSPDIERRLTDDQVEVFVGGDAAQALEREFERLSPRYIALHDVGTSTSLRLLTSMAETTDSKVMRLTVRRQGHGVALATLQFVEIVAADGATIRAYSTDIDADSHSRHEMARLLLAHATLGVLLFGDLPQHALKPSAKPLLDALRIAPWRTRELLLLPLGSPGQLTFFAGAFGGGGVHTKVGMQAPRPNDAWSQIGAAWSRLHHASAAAGTRGEEAATEPMGLRDPGPETAAPSGVWVEYVNRCSTIKGMISCCVFDRSSGRTLAHVGGRPELLQALGERLLLNAGEVGAMMGTGSDVREALLSYATHHVLLHSLPHHRGIVLHLVIDAAHGNPTLARAQLQRFDPQ